MSTWWPCGHHHCHYKGGGGLTNEVGGWNGNSGVLGPPNCFPIESLIRIQVLPPEHWVNFLPSESSLLSLPFRDDGVKALIQCLPAEGEGGSWNRGHLGGIPPVPCFASVGGGGCSDTDASTRWCTGTRYKVLCRLCGPRSAPSTMNSALRSARHQIRV